MAVVSQSILYISVIYSFLPLALNYVCNTKLPIVPPNVGAAVCTPHTPKLPSRLVIAYASWGQCDDALKQAAANGANVLIWFSINLESVDGAPRITGALPGPDCIAKVVKSIRDARLPVLHMVSVGGWNARLPNTTHSAAEWFDAFVDWNKNVVARPHLNWHGFDGIDWDLEGNDDAKEVRNHVTSDHLPLVGQFSVLAKRAGYLVSLAPAQSCLDVENDTFNLTLAIAPSWRPDFPYHCNNLYTYWLAFYNETKLHFGESVPTFNWTSLQIYEGWSRANDALATRNMTFTDYLHTLASNMAKGWTVDFGDHGGENRVHVPQDRLVIGFANGWALPYPPAQKFLLVMPDHVKQAWGKTRVKGFMFWTVDEEGHEVNGHKLFLAKELSDIVKNS